MASASDPFPENGAKPRPFIPNWLRPDTSRRTSAPAAPVVFTPDWARAAAGAENAPALIGRKTHAAENAPPPAALLPATGGRAAAAGVPAAPVLIRGGRCVLPGLGVLRLDLKLAGGIITAIGRELSAEGCAVVEAAGNYVIPGVIDPHTHVGLFSPFAEEIASESLSAISNGVTTLGIYLAGQQSYLSLLDPVLAAIHERSSTDVFLHLAIFTRAQLEEIPIYRSRYGITSFKAYMCGIPGLIPSLDEGFLLDLMEAVAALGEGAVLNVHAENHRIVEWATARVKARNPELCTLETWTQTHPDFAEAEAVERAVRLAGQTGVRLYFVHISSAEALETIRRLKAAGKEFFVETTSPYLTLTDQTALGPLAKMVPPIRGESDRRALWQALATGFIDTIGSDHTPLTRAEKKPGALSWETSPGYPAVGTHLPSLLHAARAAACPIERLVEKTALNPARIFGLYPRKGTLLPGADADVVVVDPQMIRRVSAQTAKSRADYALHQGDDLTGWPVAVFKSGVPVVGDGRPATHGRYLGRGPLP